MRMHYYIWTIGCQMNDADSRQLAAALEELGYLPAARAEEANVVVLNTCVVRQQAEDKAIGRLSALRPLKQRRPQAIIAVMGCLVGIRDPLPLRQRYPWVDVWLPPSEPGPLLELLTGRAQVDEARAMAAAEALRRQQLHEGWLLPPSQAGQVVTAHIPIVLGCSHACTYCVIPYRRGAERSRPPAEILAEARTLAAQGVRQVTLLGQIVDRYGYDLQVAGRKGAEEQTAHATPRPAPMVELLRQLHDIDGLQRLRFLTSHPNWMHDDLLQAVAELPKVCEHIELPVQAGDDEVLARMRRGYTADDYRRLVERIRQLIPGVSIATDVIVGFPGESAAHFQHTYDLLAELRLDRAHIARYSPRPQTLAIRRYPDDVPEEEKERRRLALDELQTAIVGELNAGLLGQTVEVLVEGQKKGRWWGRTRTDRLVFFDDPQEWLGQLVQVCVTWAGPWSLVGEVDDTYSKHV